VATEILLPARGLVETGQGFGLSPSSAASADFAAGYYGNHQEAFAMRGGVIVAPGSYPPGNNFRRTPWAYEAAGIQIAQRLADLGVPPRHVRAHHVAGTGLEAVLHIAEAHPFRRGRVTDQSELFYDGRPLGIAAPEGQMDHLLWLAGRVLELPKDALLPLVVSGEDDAGAGLTGRPLQLATRFIMAGAFSPDSMRKREALSRVVLSRVHGAPERHTVTTAR